MAGIVLKGITSMALVSNRYWMMKVTGVFLSLFVNAVSNRMFNYFIVQLVNHKFNAHDDILNRI